VSEISEMWIKKLRKISRHKLGKLNAASTYLHSTCFGVRAHMLAQSRGVGINTELP